MVDDTDITEVESAEPDAPEEDAPEVAVPEEDATAVEKTGLLSTKKGRIIVIGAALGGFVVVVALVAFLIFSFVIEDEATDLIVETIEQVEDGDEADAAGEEEATPAPKDPVENSDVYVFRDIFFDLLLEYIPVETETVTPTEPTDTTIDTSTVDGLVANTLYLIELSSYNDEPVGRFYWNGETYSSISGLEQDGYMTVGEGDRLGDTAWSVVSLGTDSAVMQYGDVQVTLRIGQGITK